MATTDAKPGFRLPWSADRTPGDPSDRPGDDASATNDATTPVEETESPAMIDAAPAANTNEAAVGSDGVTPPTETETPAPAPVAAPAASSGTGKKPNKFMADLTKAMQSAAESARSDAMDRLGVDAKGTIEAIHADSANEASELRKQCDDDIASVREWSKAEIARIREETDERITHRKERLEREIEEHAAEIESRIERVQGRVTAFENEMSAFFERLLGEDDPTRFAAMAESLPEPPTFDSDEPVPNTFAASAAAAAESESVEATAEVVADQPEVAAEATSDAAQPDWPAAEDLTSTAAVPAGDGDLFSIGADEPAADDPRLAALGASPDFAAAEAEAADTTQLSQDDGSDEPIAEIGDETIAARLAGLVPESDSTPDAPAADAAASTRLVVVGLVSVASIAGFKRHLSKAQGVRSVGVSSGPDGEFIYQVTHDPNVALRDVVSGLPGFSARITGETDDALNVTAQDPESGN